MCSVLSGWPVYFPGAAPNCWLVPSPGGSPAPHPVSASLSGIVPPPACGMHSSFNALPSGSPPRPSVAATLVEREENNRPWGKTFRRTAYCRGVYVRAGASLTRMQGQAGTHSQGAGWAGGRTATKSKHRGEGGPAEAGQVARRRLGAGGSEEPGVLGDQLSGVGGCGFAASAGLLPKRGFPGSASGGPGRRRGA